MEYSCDFLITFLLCGHNINKKGNKMYLQMIQHYFVQILAKNKSKKDFRIKARDMFLVFFITSLNKIRSKKAAPANKTNSTYLKFKRYL